MSYELLNKFELIFAELIIGQLGANTIQDGRHSLLLLISTKMALFLSKILCSSKDRSSRHFYLELLDCVIN